MISFANRKIEFSHLNIKEKINSIITPICFCISEKKRMGVMKRLSVQFNSVTQSYLTLCDPIDCGTPGLPVHHRLLSLLNLMSIESVMPSNHLILYHPLFLLLSSFPRIRVFSNESALHMRWPKYWHFSFSISPSNEHPGKMRH